MNMTNKEFLDEMFPYYEDMDYLELIRTASRRVGAEKMSEWKEQQMIGKAVEWLTEQTLPRLTLGAEYQEIVKEFVDDFKQYMGGITNEQD